MGEEHCIEDLGQVGYRLLGKKLHGPVRDTVQAWTLADIETPDGFLDLSGLINLGSLAGIRK